MKPLAEHPHIDADATPAAVRHADSGGVMPGKSALAGRRIRCPAPTGQSPASLQAIMIRSIRSSISIGFRQ